MKQKMSNLELHIAGATVRVPTAFDDIPTYTSDFEID